MLTMVSKRETMVNNLEVRMDSLEIVLRSAARSILSPFISKDLDEVAREVTKKREGVQEALGLASSNDDHVYEMRHNAIKACDAWLALYATWQQVQEQGHSTIVRGM